MDSYNALIYNVLIAMAFFVWFAFMIIKRARNKSCIDAFETSLKDMDFEITTRVVPYDFVHVSTSHRVGTWLGMWIDYKSNKITIRNSSKVTVPRIYTFSDLLDFELFEGGKNVYRGVSVGFGPFIGWTKEYVEGLEMKIVFGGNRGTSSYKLVLFCTKPIDRVMIGGNMKKSSELYRGVQECAETMVDELRNIIQIR